MAGKTPYEAVKNYLNPIQLSLSCISHTVITVSPRGYENFDGHSHSLLIERGYPIKLPASSGTYYLGIRHQYIIVEAEGDRGPYKVSTKAYEYKILNDKKQEILAYHWHPQSQVKYPHLHIKQVSGSPISVLQKAHIPTSRIAIEDIVALLLDPNSFGVNPHRNDWETILESGRNKFHTWKTW